MQLSGKKVETRGTAILFCFRFVVLVIFKALRADVVFWMGVFMLL